MTFCYTPRSVTSAIIKETPPPPHSRWRQNRDLGTLSPKWNITIKSIPSGLRESCGRGGGKNVRAKEEGKSTAREKKIL